MFLQSYLREQEHEQGLRTSDYVLIHSLPHLKLFNDVKDMQ